jgi:2-amino-4-hydroxy-6-hydroxymethyldihydropteridine diphosphokinase
VLVKEMGRRSIYVALGANLDHPTYGSPRDTLTAALAELSGRRVRILQVSPWYRTAPVPASDQPWYVNAVAEVATDLSADQLLAELHGVEDLFGRLRGVPNAARLIDLDLLDFRGEIAAGGPGRAILPHPRLGQRAFVLRPLADLAPDWRHPVTGLPVSSMLASLPPNQVVERLWRGPERLPFGLGCV